MKNLFSLDRTADEYNVRIDKTPFTTDAVPDEALKEMTEIRLQVIGRDSDRPRVKMSPLLWVGLGVMAAAVVPILILRGSMFAEGRLWIALVDLLLLLVSAVCIAAAGRQQRRALAESYNRETQMDFEEAMERMHKLTDESRKQLGVPNRTEEIDVLPFVYRRKGDGKKPIGKKDKYDNIPALAWVYGKELCLSDCRTVLHVPLESILGYVTYDKPFVVATWVKSVSCDSARYKPFGLRSFGMMSVSGRGYHGVVLRAGNGDSYELLIPSYELPTLQRLTGVKELSPAAGE